MEQKHEERIINKEIERVLGAFVRAVECVPRGVCEPDAAHVVIGKHYVAFVAPDGEVKLINNNGFFAEVMADGYKVITDAWDMFTLKSGKQRIYSPRLVVDGYTYTTEELIELVRKGFRVLLDAANWV